MNLKNHYWYFQSALSTKFCDDLVKYGKEKKPDLALIGNFFKKKNIHSLNKKELKELKEKRNSNISWLNDRWIYNEILPYVSLANKNAGWNFEYNYSEDCQFTKYKNNQFYDWHCDNWEEPYDNPENLNFHGKIRKLSVTCSLSEPKDYEGGELEFDFRNMDPDKKPHRKICEEILPKGSIVVFPSFVWHRVRPVKKGTRYSLVIWNIGYPFK